MQEFIVVILKSGTILVNRSRNNIEERIQKIVRIKAGTREDIDKAETGDVVGIIGFKKTYTGDTLGTKKNYFWTIRFKRTSFICYN